MLNDEQIGRIMALVHSALPIWQQFRELVAELNVTKTRKLEESENDTAKAMELAFRARQVVTVLNLETVADHGGAASIPPPTPAAYLERQFVFVVDAVPCLVTTWTIPEAEWMSFIRGESEKDLDDEDDEDDKDDGQSRESPLARPVHELASDEPLVKLASAFNRLSPVVQWFAVQTNEQLARLYPNGWRSAPIEEVLQQIAAGIEEVSRTSLVTSSTIGKLESRDANTLGNAVRYFAVVAAHMTVAADVLSLARDGLRDAISATS